MRRLILLWTKEWGVLGLGLSHSGNKAKSQVPPCRLCPLSQILLAPHQPAPSPLVRLPPPSCTLPSCPIFKFLTYSLNLLALVPLHALACRLRNMAQTHFAISAQFWLPTPCGHSCLVQPPGGKSLLPAEQDMDTKYTVEQWREQFFLAKLCWDDGKMESQRMSRMGKGGENIPNKAELVSEEK